MIMNAFYRSEPVLFGMTCLFMSRHAAADVIVRPEPAGVKANLRCVWCVVGPRAFQFIEAVVHLLLNCSLISFC